MVVFIGIVAAAAVRPLVVGRFTAGCDSGDVAVAAVHIVASWLVLVLLSLLLLGCIMVSAHVIVGTSVKSTVSNQF